MNHSLRLRQRGKRPSAGRRGRRLRTPNADLEMGSLLPAGLCEVCGKLFVEGEIVKGETALLPSP